MHTLSHNAHTVTQCTHCHTMHSYELKDKTPPEELVAHVRRIATAMVCAFTSSRSGSCHYIVSSPFTHSHCPTLSASESSSPKVSVVSEFLSPHLLPPRLPPPSCPPPPLTSSSSPHVFLLPSRPPPLTSSPLTSSSSPHVFLLPSHPPPLTSSPLMSSSFPHVLFLPSHPPPPLTSSSPHILLPSRLPSPLTSSPLPR